MHRLLLTLFVAFAPLAFAATDVSGKWNGKMDVISPDGALSSTPVTAELKQSGKTVTGIAGVAGGDQLQIENGAMDSDRLTFEVHTAEGVYAVKATVGESQLKGEVIFTAQGGSKQTASLVMARN